MADIDEITFVLDEKFYSFENLSKKLDKYKQQKFVDVYKRDARSIAAAVKRMPIRGAKISPALKYYEIRYCCTHGGKTFKPSGNGIRSTSTFQMDCPFFLKYSASSDGQHLVLTKSHVEHQGHETTEVS